MAVTKIDLAPYVGACLEVTAPRMRSAHPILFTDIRARLHLEAVERFLEEGGRLVARREVTA